MAKIKKEIVYIPVHLEYETEKDRDYLISKLCEPMVSLSSSTYYFSKKKCAKKDIKTAKSFNI